MSFLGAIGRGLVGAAKGFASGGPLGAFAGAAKGVLSRPAGPTNPPAAPTPSNLPMIAPAQLPTLGFFGGPDVPKSTPGAVPQVGTRGAIERFLPFGQSGYQAAPPGYHVNKVYLAYLRGTQLGKTLQDPTSARRVTNAIVKNRSMNPLNARALRRANARQVAAVRLMRSTLRGTGYTITRRGFGRAKGRR